MKTFACITLTTLTLAGANLCFGNDVNGTNKEQNVTLTTEDSWTLEDFITINLYEMYRMFQTHGLRFMGKFQNISWLLGHNNTKYLLVVKTKEQRIKEWREKLSNHTGDQLICVDGLCLPKELAELRWKTLKAELHGRIRPLQRLPFAFMVSILGVTGLLGITGNLLIISGVLGSKKMRNSTSVFLSGLALSDIVILGLCLPLQVATHFFSDRRFFPLEVCRGILFAKHFSIAMSSLTMTFIAIERYIAICHPLKAKSCCTVRNACYCTLVICLICLGFGVPVIFTVKDTSENGCMLTFRARLHLTVYFTGVLIIVLGLPVSIMLALYLRMFTVLWSSNKECKILKSADSLADAKTQSDPTVKLPKKVVKMLSVVLIVFVLSWGPAVVFDTSTRIYEMNRRKHFWWTSKASVGLNSLRFCNSFFNPLIYMVFSRQFRDYVKGLFPCRRTSRLKTTQSSGVTTRTTEPSRLN